MSQGISHSRGRVSELTHLAPIKQGFVAEGSSVRYADRLRLMLEASNTREDSGFPSVIRLFRGIHSANWALIDGDSRLLLNVVFDGDLHGYLRALAYSVPHLLDLIWCNCEGWQPVHNNPQCLIEFIESYQVRASFFFVQHPQLTVPDVERLVALDKAVVSCLAPTQTAAPLHGVVERVARECAPRSNAQRLEQALAAFGDAASVARSKQAFQALLTPYYPESAVRGALIEAYGASAGAESAEPGGSDAAFEVDLQELTHEVQGNVIESYADACCARMLFLSLPEGPRARDWLQGLRRHITHAEPKAGVSVNLGFTYEGLEKVGLDATALLTFPAAFREGMGKRSAELGDREAALDLDVPPWTRACDAGRPLHAVVIVHVPQSEAPRSLIERLHAAGAAAQARGLAQGQQREPRADAAVVADVLSRELGAVLDMACRRLGLAESDFAVDDGRPRYLGHQDLHKPLVRAADGASYAVEYFGFRDGIAQPRLALRSSGRPDGSVPVHALVGSAGLQRYGTFMVLRQLRQEPDAFWQGISQQAQALGTSAIELAERIVGRRMDGRRLDSKSERFDAVRDQDAFDADSPASGCPFHSHVRRLNPRSEHRFELNPPIWRRSLAYAHAAPVSGKPAVQGTMFVALNADIETQFEFVQRRWLQSGDHVGLASNVRDVLTGLQTDAAVESGWVGEYSPTGSSELARGALRFSQSFVYLEWGAYLFIPSRSTLAALAGSPEGTAVQGGA